MSCLDEDAISALLGGQLDIEALRHAEAHMDACLACRELVSTLAAENVESATEEAARSRIEGLGGVVGDRFTLEAVAGRGGMGRVYRAHDRRTDAKVALKRIMHGEDARFSREARLLSDLAHPAIVQHVADGVDADGTRYLAMEWLDGIDLAQRLERGPLSVEETVTLARRVASALGAAHERGVVHRDIKPSNLFLPHGRVDLVKVVDFGLAHAPLASSVRTRAGVLLGTLGYMAPEQAQGSSNIGPAADVFSLGCVLYECLTGERAFGGAHAIAVLSNLLVGKPPRPRARRADVPRPLDSLVVRMLARDPARRPASGAEVEAELASLGSLRQLARPTRAHLAALFAFAVVALGAVLAVRSLRLSRAVAPPHAPEGPQAITDHPISEGFAREAAVEYQAGLQAVRDAALARAREHLLRALTLDPTLAAAHLRLSIWTDTVMTGAEARSHFDAARTNAHKLTDRDRELLHAVEPSFLVEPPNMDECDRRLRALAERRPNDAELVLLGIGVSGPQNRADEYDSVLRIDPAFAYAWWARANAEFRINDTAAARTSVDRCLAAAPSATLCVLLRTRIDAREGRCEEMERDARLVIALENGGDSGYGHLANALTAQGADRRAVEEAVHARAASSPDPRNQRKVELYDLAQATVAFGDFTAAEGHARALDELVKDESFMQEHVRTTMLLVEILEEQGDDRGAAREADAFLRRMAAWRSVARRPNDEPVPSLVAAAVRGGRRPAAELTRERDAWLSVWRTKLGAAAEEEVWIQGWARPARTERDLFVAVEVMPAAAREKTLLPSPQGWISPQGFSNAYGGRVQQAAGHSATAILTLSGVTRHCAVLADASTQRRAFLWLGQAYEAAGDPRAACTAYRGLLQRWGKARPRSVSADTARARAMALGCDSTIR